MVIKVHTPIFVLLANDSDLYRHLSNDLDTISDHSSELMISKEKYISFRGFISKNTCQQDITNDTLLDGDKVLKRIYFNGTGGIMIGIEGLESLNIEIRWQDYHECEKDIILVGSAADRPRPFSKLFNQKKKTRWLKHCLLVV